MRIALLGTGRMGAAVAEAAAAAGHDVAVRLGRDALAGPETEVVGRIAGVDVAIDFTSSEQVARSVRAAAAAGVDVVVGTTGWSAAAVDFDAVAKAGRGVVHGANFSLGVQLFLRLAKEAARMAGVLGGYDAHVDEVHHRHKRDHPSGTAIRIAEVMLAEMTGSTRWAPGPPDGPPDPAVLYVTSVRAGEVPGSHTIGFEGRDDRIELRHDAHGRAGFARGAVRAAEWIRGRPGVHTFDEVVSDLLDPRRAP